MIEEDLNKLSIEDLVNAVGKIITERSGAGCLLFVLGTSGTAYCSATAVNPDAFDKLLNAFEKFLEANVANFKPGFYTLH